MKRPADHANTFASWAVLMGNGARRGALPTGFMPSKAAMRRAILAAVLYLIFSVPALAHFEGTLFPIGQVAQETQIQRRDNMIVIRYGTRIAPSMTLLLNPDADGDGRISKEEKTIFLRQTDKNIRPNLDITIDDLPAALTFEPEGVWPGPGGLAEGMFVSMLYIIDLGGIPPGKHVFRMEDKNFRAGELAWLSYWVHGGAGFRDIEISKDTRTLTCRFSLGRDIKTGPSQTQGAPAKPAPPDETKIESATLAGFVREKDLSAGVILLALGMAFVLGMTHALSPGHGKAMVAAYLIGSRGRIRDAVFLGGVVTMTHVLSVIILGLVILFLSQHIVPQKMFPWLGVGSGLLVFLVGYWMLAGRVIGATGHGHEHHHTHDRHAPDHAHTHEHSGVHDHSQTPKGKTTLGGMLSLGVAGGMVPCPTALVVLLTAVAIHRIAFGLLLIAVFSLGLAVVLILIGILTVTASRVTNFFSEQRKWIQLLPVFSAGAIIVIGVSIAFNSLLSAGILTFNR